MNPPKYVNYNNDFFFLLISFLSLMKTFGVLHLKFSNVMLTNILNDIKKIHVLMSNVLKYRIV